MKIFKFLLLLSLFVTAQTRRNRKYKKQNAGA